MAMSQCLVCLEYASEIIKICEKDYDESPLPVFIYKVFALNVTIQQSSVCLECYKYINDFFTFYQKVQLAHFNSIAKNDDDDKLIPIVKIEKDPSIEFQCEYPAIKVEPLELETSKPKLDENGIVLQDYLSDDNVENVESAESDKTIPKKVTKSAKKNNPKVRAKRIRKSRAKPLCKSIVGDPDDPRFPNVLDENGKFIITRAPLEALVNRFYNLSCSICSESPKFLTSKLLFDHYNDVHKMKGFVVCCDIKLEKKNSINWHLAKHIQPEMFTCLVCHQALSCPEDIKKHKLKHLPDSQKPHICDQCGKGFIMPFALRDHKVSHIAPQDREIHKCKICHKKYTLLTSFKVHMSTTHGSQHLCTECGKCFGGKTKYMLHLQSHHSTENRSVECHKCGLILANKGSLQKHLRRHVIEVRCSLCDYVAHRKFELVKHIRIRHTDDKPYVCGYCHKAFKIKTSLQIHMAQHTGERKYSCPFCPRTFVDPANCFTHKKKKHPVELKNYPKKKRVYVKVPDVNNETCNVAGETTQMQDAMKVTSDADLTKYTAA